MFGFVRVVGTSRADNGVANRGYSQVRRDFWRTAETACPPPAREADHREFVSRTTTRAALPATMATRECRKALQPAPTRQHTYHRSLPDRRSAPATPGIEMAPNHTAPQCVSITQWYAGRAPYRLPNTARACLCDLEVAVFQHLSLPRCRIELIHRPRHSSTRRPRVPPKCWSAACDLE
jgi:hypothetical protein